MPSSTDEILKDSGTFFSVDHGSGQEAGFRRRPKRRDLRCPAHPDQQLGGTGRKYYLHLLTSEELKQRGVPDKTARLVIQAHPVLVLNNEWLEELFCPDCGTSRWCHITRHSKHEHRVRWAPRELWQQVAHVDPVVSNPSVSEFSRREARRHQRKRADGAAVFDSDLMNRRP